MKSRTRGLRANTDGHGRAVERGPSKYFLISCTPSLVFEEVHRLLKNVSGLSSLPLLGLIRSFSMTSFSLTIYVGPLYYFPRSIPPP